MIDQETYGIIGAALEVHKGLGPGFLEAVDKEALSMELAARGIPFAREAETAIFYKGTELKTSYRSDFVCHGSIIVELKAISKLGDLEMAQVCGQPDSAKGFYSISAQKASKSGDS